MKSACESLLQASARRLSGAEFAPPLVVTGMDFRFVVTEQLRMVGIGPGSVLIEPEGRNTAPAILAAAFHLVEQDPQAVMLVAPSDHVIPDAAAFRATVLRGMPALEAGQIVTFRIAPDRAETGYGYLELSADSQGRENQAGGPVGLRRFVEKPGPEAAAQMLAAGNYLWNAGIFLCRAADLIGACARYAPGLCDPVRAALEAGRADLGFLRLEAGAWAQADNVSIDYAVMERTDNLVVVPFDGAWSDLGDWEAVWREGGDAREVSHPLMPRRLIARTRCCDQRRALEVVGIGLQTGTYLGEGDIIRYEDVYARGQGAKG